MIGEWERSRGSWRGREKKKGKEEAGGGKHVHRYNPTRPWSCGDASKDEFVFPEPVDRVDPDYFVRDIL